MIPMGLGFGSGTGSHLELYLGESPEVGMGIGGWCGWGCGCGCGRGWIPSLRVVWGCGLIRNPGSRLAWNLARHHYYVVCRLRDLGEDDAMVNVGWTDERRSRGSGSERGIREEEWRFGVSLSGRS